MNGVKEPPFIRTATADFLAAMPFFVQNFWSHKNRRVSTGYCAKPATGGREFLKCEALVRAFRRANRRDDCEPRGGAYASAPGQGLRLGSAPHAQAYAG
jgi:hypothetical protein